VKQLEFCLKEPPRIDLDGIVSTIGHSLYNSVEIRYIGKATQQFNGTWRCLADVAGMLCVVELVGKVK
jgi:hypothetical protein